MAKNILRFLGVSGIFLSVIGIALIYTTPIPCASIKSQNNNGKPSQPISMVAHSPILIDGNISSFSEKTGSGTEADPYIIQNMEISNFGTIATTNGTYRGPLLVINTNEHVIFRNIVIENIIDSSYRLQCVLIRFCNNIQLENITVQNCRIAGTTTQYCLDIWWANNIKVTNFIFSNTSVYGGYMVQIDSSVNVTLNGYRNVGLVSLSSSAIYDINIDTCYNVVISNVYISDSAFASSEYTVFQFFENTSNVIVNNSVVQRIQSVVELILFTSVATTKNCTIQNSIFQDIWASAMDSNELSGESINFLNNTFKNLYAENHLHVIRLMSLIKSRFAGNTFKNLSSTLDETRGFIILGVSIQNTFYNNQFQNLSSRDQLALCMDIAFSTYDNYIYNNRFMGGSILVRDNGVNYYSGLMYFTPLKMECFVGNYWIDHHLDSKTELHYFIETPRSIAGNGNNSDPLPLHYFGMDFDQDRLINFYENKYGWDIWNPDTDNDTVLDGDEQDPTLILPISPWVNILNDPQSVLLIILTSLMLFSLFQKPFLMKKQKLPVEKEASKKIESTFDKNDSKSKQ